MFDGITPFNKVLIMYSVFLWSIFIIYAYISDIDDEL